MRPRMFTALLFSVIFLILSCGTLTAGNVYTNSIGMDMVKIKPGWFVMGSADDEVSRDHWDEKPAHRVTIGNAFKMSVTEVTLEQYREFDPKFEGTGGFEPYVAGVSWNQARAFCKWLSKKEGKHYRLPTEAEWEYACRAGTTTLYSSGDTEPAPETANPWGLKNMHTGVREWCLDWHGAYSHKDQTDPVGPETGMAKVVRGGLLDDGGRMEERKVWNSSASRCAIAPNFGIAPSIRAGKVPNTSGFHNIGFRIVEAPMPRTEPLACEAPFVRQCVKRGNYGVRQGPSADKPYYRKRYLITTPPDNCTGEEIDTLGFHPALREHNHSPALEVCPNGDILMITYTSYDEYEPGVSMMATRLRYGSDQWDIPERMLDFVGVNDHATLLWKDRGKLYLFWGNPKLKDAYPFQYVISQDNGATWSDVHFPDFANPIGGHSKQPINTAFRDRRGTIYVSTDGNGGHSLLWASHDNGRTWRDTVGRTHGRHTVFAPIEDGCILGLGGKNTNINGWMPKSVSCDGGKTWKKEITPFPAQGSNQRPCLITLQSGRLFFCADFQDKYAKQPEGVSDMGSYAALSEDQGNTWHIKKLIGTLPHEQPTRLGGADTIGYSVARQAPNGLIHLMTTMNRPCLHLAMNEAWILDSDTPEISDEELMAPMAAKISKVRQYHESYPGLFGPAKATWSAGTGDDGLYLLDGKQTFYYRNGGRQWEVSYRIGQKRDLETYWRPDGSIKWQWQHHDDGTSIWTQYWPSGVKKAQSRWKNQKAEGQATLWDRNGNIISQKVFANGRSADPEGK